MLVEQRPSLFLKLVEQVTVCVYVPVAVTVLSLKLPFEQMSRIEI